MRSQANKALQRNFVSGFGNLGWDFKMDATHKIR